MVVRRFFVAVCSHLPVSVSCIVHPQPSVPPLWQPKLRPIWFWFPIFSQTLGGSSVSNGDISGRVFRYDVVRYLRYSPGVGNHESIDDFLAFRLRYSTDLLIKNSGGGEFYWSFDFGIIHFIHLSSENDFNVSSPQYNWLQNDLKKVNRTLTPWVIGIWHRPWYTSSETHGEDDAMRVALEPLFITYKVDLAIVGHVHSYERITEIANHVITKDATAYITIGNGGTPEGLAKNWKPQPDWSKFRLAEWGYARLRVYNATHAHWEMRTDSNESTTDDHWFVRTRN